MHSSEGTSERSNHHSQEVDNSEKLNEVTSASLENVSNQVSMLPKTRDNLGLKEFSTIATQTPLTFIRFTLTQSLSDNQFTDSTTSPTLFNQGSIHEANEPRENVKLHTSVRNQMSITLSREADMQATASYSSVIHSISRIPRDSLQISASLSSDRSEARNEVLTVTTDYGNASPEARSSLVDAVDRNGDRGLHLSVQNAYNPSHTLELTSPRVEPVSDHSTTSRRNHRRWSLNSCLRCTLAVQDEPDRRPYMRDAPPTYSALYTTRATSMHHRRPFRWTQQSSFVAPTPPPNYTQALGIHLTSYSMDQLFSMASTPNGFWSPRPTTAICPRCTMTVVTVTEDRLSTITHVTAFALFLCGCWPCCMIPYCMNSCKTIDHFCPLCRAHLGTYRPW